VNGRSMAQRPEGGPPIRHIANDPLALAEEPETRVSQADDGEWPEILEPQITRVVGAYARCSYPIRSGRPFHALTLTHDVEVPPATRGLFPGKPIAQAAGGRSILKRTVRRRR
jgi:hypothetical protein